MRTFLIPCFLVLTLGAGPATAGSSSWSEDFEGVNCGALPADWMSGGGNSDFGTVWEVGDVVCQGEHALGLCGQLGVAWAALVAYPVSPVDMSAPSLFSLTFRFRGGSETLSGPYPGRVYVDLSATVNWTGNRRGLFVMAANGDLTGSGLALGSVDLLTCHTMRIDYTRPDATTIEMEYWLDGASAGAETLAAAAFEDDLIYFHFGSLEGSAWVDDIQVTVTTTTSLEPETWGRVKALHHD